MQTAKRIGYLLGACAVLFGLFLFKLKLQNCEAGCLIFCDTVFLLK